MDIFIANHYTIYNGNSDFLTGPTQRTKQLWDYCFELITNEQRLGIKVDTKTPSTITSHDPDI